MFKVRHSELPACYIDMFKLIQTFTCTQLDMQMTTIFHFLELIYLRIIFAILVQCCGTLLNPILRCYQMLISLSVHINDMSSQKTRQCMINCSILSTKLLGYCFLNVLMGYFSYFILQVFTLYIRFPVHKSLNSWDPCLFDSILHCFYSYYCNVAML